MVDRRRIRSLCFRYNTGQRFISATALRSGHARGPCSVARRESNPRSRAPKAREVPFLFLPVLFLRCSDPCGIRTQPLQLERLITSPEVERAILSLYARTDQRCASVPGAVGREALESSSAAFQATADQRCASVPASQLTTHVSLRDPLYHVCIRPTKKARCPCDIGLWQPADRKGQASQAQRMRQGILSERIISARGITDRDAFLQRTWSKTHHGRNNLNECTQSGMRPNVAPPRYLHFRRRRGSAGSHRFSNFYSEPPCIGQLSSIGGGAHGQVWRDAFHGAGISSFANADNLCRL